MSTHRTPTDPESPNRDTAPPWDPLAAVVSAFAAANPALCDPVHVHDRCATVSEEFRRFCTDHGIEASIVTGMKMGEVPEFPGMRVALQGHIAVRVGDQVYDWTARQFTRDAAVPTVTSLDTWRAEWPPLGQPQ